MRLLSCVSTLLLLSCAGYAQTAPISPIVTLGITSLVVGKPTTIQALITNPTFSPVPTGQVTIDFGDGSEPIQLSISTTWVGTTHIYLIPGQFTITASYSGDSTFASATTSLNAVTVLSVPIYGLYTFGDSLTGGLDGTWPVLLINALGWPRYNFACGGCRTNDLAPDIYNSVVNNTYASTWLLGQNDHVALSSSSGINQFQAAVLAENAWLAIPEGPAKLRAQSNAVAQNGSWTSSDLYTTTGLRSSVANSTLTASVEGSAIYVGLSSLTTSDYTVDILIDGVDKGTTSPKSTYIGEYQASEPYGLRYVLGGERTASHIVQIICQNPGTSGCYVDWIGGNGAATKPNLPPYVWTGISYTTLQPDETGSFPEIQGIVRGIEEQLESDGLAVRKADIASLFNGPSLPECVADGVHPNACGNQIEETVWLSAMSYLATEAQRIDIRNHAPLVVGVSYLLNYATATSGLPVSYTLVSGPGTISNCRVTAVQAGTLVIDANQSGDATVMPALPVRFSVTATNRGSGSPR